MANRTTRRSNQASILNLSNFYWRRTVSLCLRQNLEQQRFHLCVCLNALVLVPSESELESPMKYSPNYLQGQWL
ncbi:hypothetical protein LENED_000866 [Lentinula edodes]|uniref:Uncharacterized protein n=1 Tax=Lentinula edodes TaxID=5353 RepID=A0A1Q3DWV0_LENED|nr:hypothetical protein LENED_000866 [Lentinula edodes]